MDLTKSIEFFDPTKITNRIHIIGCGSIGSTLAENLARLGLTKFCLYDFDVVDKHNLANQMFYDKDIGKLKVDAVKENLLAINPLMDVKTFPEGWVKGTRLDGYVFLCVDNIDLRREICEANNFNLAIKTVFDFRTLLTGAQLFAARWDKPDEKKQLMSTMQFTHDEAKSSTPRTACGIEIGVAPTIRIGVGYGVSNFINYLKGQPLKTMLYIDAFGFLVIDYDDINEN